jgi:BA14K-like protein
MSKTMTRWMAAVLVAVAVPSFASVAPAAPVSGALAIKNAVPAKFESVRWYGRGWGWGVGGGLVAGAIVGGLLAAPYYYGGYYGPPAYYGGYYGAPAYYGGSYGRTGYYGGPYSGGGYYAQPAGGGGDVDYCIRRYRTYDLRSGTFMGNDGRRHPCP